MSIRLSIIIVTYHRPQEVLRLLQSVVTQDYPRANYEICVIDNGGELTTDIVQKIQTHVDYFKQPADNLGVCYARNLAVSCTQAPLLLFLDDDGVLGDHALRYIDNYMQNHAQVMAIRGRIVPLEHPFFSSVARHYSRGKQICPELLIIEGATVIRRSPYFTVHGYRVGLFGNEGLDLSERLLQAFPQDKIEYHPQFILYHDFVNSWKELWFKAKRMAHSQMSTKNTAMVNQSMLPDSPTPDPLTPTPIPDYTSAKDSSALNQASINQASINQASINQASINQISMSNAQEAENNIQHALQRYKNYNLIDDRSLLLKLYAKALNRVYLILIALHRFLNHSKL
jgi:glycosyltransferase involved in cell wall biosynthesis